MLISEDLIAALDRLLLVTGNQPIDDFFSKIWDDVDSNSAQYRILKLFEDSESELSVSPIKVSIKDRQMQSLVASRSAFFRALNSENSASFRNKFNIEVERERLQGIADVLNTVGLQAPPPINRPEFIKDSLELCKTISKSDLPDYAKAVATLKIEALNRLVSETGRFSDMEVRLRAKAIYADFCAEFDAHDKKYQSVVEKVKGWATKAAGVGVFALALTADGSTVAGLLTGPK